MNKKLFIGKQTIFNNNLSEFAYELLYRDSYCNYCNSKNKHLTSKLLNNLKKFNFNMISNNKKLFINFSYNDLKNFYKFDINNENFVIEILEDVKQTKKLLKILIKLKNKGYILALDDVTNIKIVEFFRNYIDIYKIDFSNTNQIQRIKLLKKIKSINKDAKLLAEKISTISEFNEALLLNFDYLQGFFLNVPEIISN